MLVAIAIGIWLSSLFKGLGPGGSDTGVGTDTEVSVNVDASHSTGSASTSDELSDVGMVESDSIPTVLIEDRHYLLAVETDDGDVEYLPSSLEQIVELAARTTPDEDGLQIHIKRRRSSRAATETALDEALANAGVEEAAIRRHRDFVD